MDMPIRDMVPTMCPHTATEASTSGLEAAAVTITGITTTADGTMATAVGIGKVAAVVGMAAATAAVGTVVKCALAALTSHIIDQRHNG
jgi:hypothetical protein